MDDIFAPSQNGLKHFATPFQVTKNWKEEPTFEDYLAKNAAQTPMQIVLDGAQLGTSQRYYDEMDTALADIVMDCVASYLSPCKLTVTMVHSNIECQLAAYNLRRLAKGNCSFRAPRWEVVRRLIRDLDPFSVELARSGPVAALKKYVPAGTETGSKVDTGFEVHRAPEAIVSDSGSEFRRKFCDVGCLEVDFKIGIDASPEIRGTIERVFSQLWTTTESIPLEPTNTVTDLASTED